MSFVAEQPLHRALGLTDGEFDRIRSLLGRDPNGFELGVFSLLWSEHCGYKHSALLLRRFHTDGPAVLQGPGAKMLGNVDLSWLAGLVVAGGLYALLGSRRRQEPSQLFERQPETAAKE